MLLAGLSGSRQKERAGLLDPALCLRSNATACLLASQLTTWGRGPPGRPRCERMWQAPHFALISRSKRSEGERNSILRTSAGDGEAEPRKAEYQHHPC